MYSLCLHLLRIIHALAATYMKDNKQMTLICKRVSTVCRLSCV